MAQFFAELKRRQMFRVAAAYAVVAWLLLQIVNNVAPVLDLPPWVARALLLLLVIGFPIALLFVWMRDLAPTDGAAPRAATTRLDYTLIGALVLVIGLVSYQQLAPTPREASPDPSPQPSEIAVAVLKFENLSGDASQDYFSEGVTEEIGAVLTRVPNLNVVARTSAIAIDRQNRSVRELGQALGATHLIDGSVRRAGNRVRITAQLVRADSGLNLWSQNFDRELTDIFAIQDEIAQAIAGALGATLGLREGQRLVSSGTNDPESYPQFLRARALVRAGSDLEAIRMLEPLVARDPNYAPAWALLADAYTGATASEREFLEGPVEVARRNMQTAMEKAERAAREAIRLDPSYAGGYLRLAAIERARGNWASADDLRRQALMLDPNDPEILDGYAIGLAVAGRIKDALRVREQLLALEPFVPIFKMITADILWIDGQSAAAIRMLEGVPGDGALNFQRNAILAEAYAAAGRYAEAAETYLLITDASEVSRQAAEDAARIIRSAPAKVAAPETLPRLPGALEVVYAHVGAYDRLSERADRYERIRPGTAISTHHWSEAYAPLRKTEHFRAMVRRIGLVDYWRAKGWPDLCRAVGADDFVCD
jgi:TolB-like protein